MKVMEWLNNEIIAYNQLCNEYVEKVRKAKSKKQLFEIVCDANGVSFLPEMEAHGCPLPYDVIQEEFGRYVNGKYKPEFEGLTKASVGYTSAIYCRDKEVDKVFLSTTLACFLGCDMEVWVSPFNVSRICVDSNCHLKIYCPNNAKLVIEYWGEDDTIEIVEGKDRVRLKKMRDGE